MRTDLKQKQMDFYQDNRFIFIHNLNDEELKLWSLSFRSRRKVKSRNGDELYSGVKSQ